MYNNQDFSEGLLPIAVGKVKDKYIWKYVKQDGTFLNDQEYLTITPFSGGYANVTFAQGGKIMHGILNRSGQLVCTAENKYDYITAFYNSCAFGYTYNVEGYKAKI